MARPPADRGRPRGQASYHDATLDLKELTRSSLVVHGAGGAGARIACGNVVEGAPPTTQAHALLAGEAAGGAPAAPALALPRGRAR